jgi:hypothetical protein
MWVGERQCRINYGSSETIRITPGNSGSSFSIPRISVVDITPVCASQTSNCSGGSVSPGIEEFTFRTTWSFSALPVGQAYTLSWESCCRNFPITTIANPGSAGWYISTTLDPSLNNSSPSFILPPSTVLCLGQQTDFPAGAFDPDGDDLVYSLVNCQDNATASVSYLPGFSGTNPLSNSSGFTIDQTTGVISFTPNAFQVGVVCIKVEEFRNGVKIGEVVRDLQVSVLNCGASSPPSISPVLTQTTTVGTPVSFSVSATDPNAGDVISLSNLTSLGNLTGVTGTNPVSGTFSWTPSSPGTYNAFLQAEDDGCPFKLRDYLNVRILVAPANCSLAVSGTVTGSPAGAIDITVTNASGTPTYFWTGPNYTSTVEDPTGLEAGSYTVVVRDGQNCIATATFTVTVNDTTGPSVTCAEFIARFTGCPGGLAPNTPTGVWFSLPGNGIFGNAAGGLFTTSVNVSACVSDNAMGLVIWSIRLGAHLKKIEPAVQ